MTPVCGIDMFVFKKFTQVGINVETVSLYVQVVSSNGDSYKSSKELSSNGGLVTSWKVARYITAVLVIKENTKTAARSAMQAWSVQAP